MSVIMSTELYDRFAKINRIDQTIYESEKEMAEGGETVGLDEAFETLNKKYYEISQGKTLIYN